MRRCLPALPLCVAVLVTLSCAPPEISAAEPTAQMNMIAQAMRTSLGFTDVDFHDYTGFRSVTGVPAEDIKAGGHTKLVAVDVYPTTELAAARFALDRDYLLSDFAGNLEKGTLFLLSNRLLAIVNRKAVTSFTTTTVEGKTRAIGGAEVLFQCDNLVLKVIWTSASTIAYPESNLDQLNAETERLGREAVAPVKAFAGDALTAICGEPTPLIEIECDVRYAHVVPDEFLQGLVRLKVNGAWPEPSLTVWIALYKETESEDLQEIISGGVITGNRIDYALRTVSPVAVGTYTYLMGENQGLALKAPTEPGNYLLMAVAGNPVSGAGLNAITQTAVTVERFPKRFYFRPGSVAPTLIGGVGDTFTLNVEFDVGSVVGPPAVSIRSNLTGPDPRGIPAVPVTGLTPLLGIVDGALGTVGYSGVATVQTPPLLYPGHYAWQYTLFAPGWEPIDGESVLIVNFTGFPLDITGAATVEDEMGTPVAATNVLRFGRRLRTPAGGEALVTFPNGSRVRVAPNTTMSIDNNGRVTVDAGSVSVEGNADDPGVATPLATVSPTGTSYTVTHDPAEPATTVSVTAGSVEITPTNPAHPALTLATGQAVEVTPGANIAPPPAISSQPTAATFIVGMTAQFIVATGGAGLTYQWQQQAAGASTWSNLANGGAFSGATTAALSINAAIAMSGDLFRVIVSNSAGSSSTSTAVALTVTYVPRLLNLSTRGLAQTGDNVLIPGFVVSGTANKRLLIRAVGPTLGKPPFNLGGVLADPRMRLLKRNTTTTQFEEIATNDNWGTNTNVAAITQTSADLLAFAFNDALESALLLDLAPGEYTVIAGPSTNSGQAAGSGIAIVELYDVDGAAVDARLINISNRGFAGVGDQVMIPGFVVSAEGPKTVLVRVVGPKLGSFGVAGTMTDPKLTVFSGQTAIHSNDNWSDDPNAATTTQVGDQVFAFALDAGSKDAAMVITLQPGSYTVVGSSAVAGGTGVVLVEVYVVP